ncbi:MAG: 23S rRNA (adenine(2503)-C(2))-methyltransferase RlmN [Alphaproteobacteria bacterium]|jgi:23S rRNA (adenine2503-C2)-methyltransferase|nr:23S rRNA (adenine(2503)-C(2))-methyltransferase RlmN [Alphaproteobacteria bacterium]MDP6516592.1 23S rRNA (adenine(2503)-C(2))-methyltransferase RlmN [Alphaproteobacteria bacterium]
MSAVEFRVLPEPEAGPPPGEVASDRPNLIGLTVTELAEVIAAVAAPPFRAKQLWHWLYYRGARAFDDMETLPKALRAELGRRARIDRPTIAAQQRSEDGARKWLLGLDDGREVECVHIPEPDRGALCVSSQVGCTLNCRFCHTGTQKLVRNLSAGEIVGQLLLARDALGEWPSPKFGRMISNVVMMGMGEPLYNYDNVAKALGIFMDGAGIALSRRRITLSTAGVVPMIARSGRELGVNLAISLHAVEDRLRDELVPLNRKYPIGELLAACRDYPAGRNSRRITFEYVMLKGVNDADADARALTRLLAGIPAKVNLIPFNPWPGAPYECASNNRIRAFAAIVNDAGYSAPVRVPRGRDILAACGQLKSASERRRRGATRAAV